MPDMAGASLLTLLDDIASVLDDVALMTKVAAKKTAGVLGDDLALNAEQVSGVRAERELPVVWAVAKGSFRNKLILVPAAIAISALIPWLITPLLMLGGLPLFRGRRSWSTSSCPTRKRRIRRRRCRGSGGL
jgi:predicted DNA repair protein MutK